MSDGVKQSNNDIVNFRKRRLKSVVCALQSKSTVPSTKLVWLLEILNDRKAQKSQRKIIIIVQHRHTEHIKTDVQQEIRFMVGEE